MPAAPTQDRARETYDRIVLATLDLIGKIGPADVDHRKIADAANVSLARTTYYFASRDDMLRAAYDRLLEMDRAWFATARRELNPHLTARADLLAAAMNLASLDFARRRGQAMACLAVALEARRDETAARVYIGLLGHRREYFTRLFERAGFDRSVERAALLLSCYLGFLLRMAGVSSRAPAKTTVQEAMTRYLDVAFRL